MSANDAVGYGETLECHSGQPRSHVLPTACTFEASSSSSLATTQPASSITPGRLMYFTRPLSCTLKVMIIFITCLSERNTGHSVGDGPAHCEAKR